MVPFFFTSLISYQNGGEHHRWIAFGIFTAASITDALDGLLARVMHIRTRLGRFLDPLADKLLLLSGFLGLLFVDHFPYEPPLWVTVTIVFRDLILIAGLIMIYFMTQTLRIAPNLLGKCVTASQMLTLITILLKWRISLIFCYITAALTILSGLAYIVRELKLLNAKSEV